MKLSILRYFKYPAALIVTSSAAVIFFSCNHKLNVTPQGALTQANLENSSGVNGLLIGAYAILDGENIPVAGDAYGSSGSNWQYGSVCADDSYKGSVPTDQPDLAALDFT